MMAALLCHQWAVRKTVGSFALPSLLHSCRAVLSSTSATIILTYGLNFYNKQSPFAFSCGSDTQ